METIDIILDSSSQFIEKNGDFVLNDGANELIKYIVVSHQGHFKEFPLLGVGISSFLQGNESRAKIDKLIRQQLTNDVFPDPEIDMTAFPDKIVIDRVSISGS